MLYITVQHCFLLSTLYRHMPSFLSRVPVPRAATEGLTEVASNFEGNKTLYRAITQSVRHKLSNYEHNRTVDNTRMQGLKAYMQQKKHVPGIIYTAEKAVPDGKLSVYDGGHRYEAACQLLKRSNINLDMMIAVRSFTADDDFDKEVLEEMAAFNKRVRVPDQYTDPKALQAVKDLAREITVFVRGTWPKVFSESDSPNIPNVNAHHLEAELYKKLLDMATEEEDPVPEEQLQMLSLNVEDWLSKINDDFKHLLGPAPTGRTKHAVAKGCFLFALKPGPMDQCLDAVEAQIRSGC